MAERTITNAILRLLHQRHAWAFKTHGTGNTRNGIPDIIAVHNGHPLALEVKQPGHTATPLQHYELARAAAAGATARIVTSTHEVAAILDHLDRQEPT